jgi:Putative motility protein
MDISAIASLSTVMAQQRTAQTAELMVLKKALQLQESNAMTLIASVTPSSSLPAHLGQNVNVVA